MPFSAVLHRRKSPFVRLWVLFWVAKNPCLQLRKPAKYVQIVMVRVI